MLNPTRRRALVLAVVPAVLAGCARHQAGSAPLAPGKAAAGAHVLHNLHRVSDRILSGASPDSPEGFDELRGLGVTTIISVDGSTPDVASAAARGMRYIHVPVTYSTITDEQRLEIARAIRDLPGNVYIHCHHGMHRGPAAAAAAAVTLGIMTPERGAAFMHEAGTAESYTGLWECVASAARATGAELDAVPDSFPAVRRAEGLTAAMVEIDFAFEHLSVIKRAGWEVPSDHPDLVPAAEAGRLADNLRLAAEDPEAARHGAGFLGLLMESAKRAGELEGAIVAGEGGDSLNARIALVGADCKACHGKYRDHQNP